MEIYTNNYQMVWQSKILRLPKFEIDCLKNEKDIIDQRVPTLLSSTIDLNQHIFVIVIVILMLFYISMSLKTKIVMFRV